jgi:hypothetical protein
MLSETANTAVGDGWAAKYVIRRFVVWYWLGGFKDHGFDWSISLNLNVNTLKCNVHVLDM